MKKELCLLCGVAAFFLVVACKTENNKDLILGQWYNESLSVKLGVETGDSSFVVPAGEWESILKIKPILTTYSEDGTYRSQYKSLEGKVIRESSGSWEMKGDTLYLIEGGVTTSYHFKWMDGKAKFTGYLDWDQDGAADDLYEGVQIKK